MPISNKITPNRSLAKIIGSAPITRMEATKKFWDYIKAHNLQDKKNKRLINADGNLKDLFDGKKQISMFEVAKVISNNIEK